MDYQRLGYSAHKDDLPDLVKNIIVLKICSIEISE